MGKKLYINKGILRNSAEEKQDNRLQKVSLVPWIGARVGASHSLRKPMANLFCTKNIFPHFFIFFSSIYTRTQSEFQIQQMDEIIKKRQAAKESKKAIVFDLWICSSPRSSERSSIRAVSD